MRELPIGLECGRKIFFIVPELSLFPEEYIKSYFLKGFETYFIDDDPYCPLELKIHTLFVLFPEILLFFNVDRQIRGINWPKLIDCLQRTYQDRAMIGVMYRKKNNSVEARELERLYLYDIGINGGCVPIEYQKAKNLNCFLNVLIANQANGQRRYLRALCDETFKMNLMYQKRRYQCALRDISISHFSCVFIGELPDLPLHEKITDIQMNLRGVLLKVDGVFCLKRNLDGDLIHVFVFRNAEDREGLQPEHMRKVNDIIYNFFQTSMFAILKSEFDAAYAGVMRTRRERAAAALLSFETAQDAPRAVIEAEI